MGDSTAAPKIEEKAFAKVNLTLEIIGKRRDGYHKLTSVMQTINLYDNIGLTLSDDICVTCDDDRIPSAQNLAGKAATILSEQTGTRKGATIEIRKSIPVSAGLGGGSADAAATLRGLNKIWELGLSAGELVEIASDVGSDVPFLIRGGTALVQGRGEDVTQIRPARVPRILILAPGLESTPLDDKTAEVFSHLDQSMYTRGNLTHKLAARIRSGSDCPPEFFFNQLEVIADGVFPQWRNDRDLLKSLGADEIVLCGSGPSVFTVPPSKELGTAWQLLLNTVYKKNAFLVSSTSEISDVMDV
jgi:4-diphosphocytidyl-2-C-methyl-D-erythritol kinase